MQKNTYYFAGFVMKISENKDEFVLVKSSASSLPYVTENPNSSALRITGEYSALYAYDEDKNLLINMHNTKYELNSKMQPDSVTPNDEMTKLIKEAIVSKETLLNC